MCPPFISKRVKKVDSLSPIFQIFSIMEYSIMEVNPKQYLKDAFSVFPVLCLALLEEKGIGGTVGIEFLYASDKPWCRNSGECIEGFLDRLI